MKSQKRKNFNEENHEASSELTNRDEYANRNTQNERKHETFNPNRDKNQYQENIRRNKGKAVTNNSNNKTQRYNNDNKKSNSDQNLGTASQTKNMASTEVTSFWEKLSKRVFKPKFELHIEEQALWLETWKAAAGGAHGPVKILPIAYLRLPASADISPSPIDIINVLIQVVKSISSKQTSKSIYHNDISTVNLLEAVLDIIKLRLINLIQENYLPNVESLLEAVNELDRILKLEITNCIQIYLNETERLARLLLRQPGEMNQLIKKIKEKITTQQQIISCMQQQESKKPAWLGWQKPTLDWLMSGSWNTVEGLKAKYESSEEYTESLLKLWTLLTFYWGAGAVWPRCAFKQGGNTSSSDANVCGEPLLTATNSGLCKKNGCGRNAAWKCFRYNHDHICATCLLKQQDALIGSPGPHASTDIYDALIEREVVRREETVYLLRNVESRKPPKIAPNWKTSYRLPISVLVAVIKLNVSRESISRTSPIQWGEIVPYEIKSGVNEDWKHRSKGYMAIRLLNKTNCDGMPDENEACLDVGVRVAIIDLRVFVPEVISVLNTFSKKDFKDHLDQIPFFERLIGYGSSQIPLELNLRDSIQNIISHAIQNSEIEYIQRLDLNSKLELTRDICALKPIQSLSGTQLEAFAAALYSSIHCTQGPPGTGKSYIGVCLVLALDLVRRKAESEGHAVGPILVLSYKNHALDEFLIDVINQYQTSKRYLQPGMLIRTGKPDIEILENFTERNSNLERSARTNLEGIMLVQKNTRNLIKELLECARNLETNVELDWTSKLDILKKNNPNTASTCFDSSKAVCLALWLFYIMNNYEKTDCIDLSTRTYDMRAIFEKNMTSARQLANFSDDDLAVFKENAFYILKSLNLSLFLADELNKLNDEVFGLLKDLEHWKIPKKMSPTYFYINSWLKGKNPPLRCQVFVDEQFRCSEEAYRNSPYCHLLHNCHSLFCENQRITLKIPFCNNHNCQFQECNLERFKDTTFCSKHICSACILTNTKEIKCRNPFACNDHECTENGCNKLQIYPYKGFCIDHVCTECAETGILEKHFKRLEGSKLCKIHKCCVDNCKIKRVDNTIEFCALHLCLLCYKNNEINGADLVCPQSQLCQKHRCSNSDKCSEPKIEFSLNCENHSCKVCIALKCSSINPAINEMPRNSCKIHQLCEFVDKDGMLCNKVAEKSAFYCNEHLKKNEQKTDKNNNHQNICSGITSRQKPCKSVQTGLVNNRWFCKQHRDQAENYMNETELSDSLNEKEANKTNINNKPTSILLPVLNVETLIDNLKKISCNGKFSDKEKCDIFILGKDDTLNWFCPLHEHKNEKSSKQNVNSQLKEENFTLINDEPLENDQINVEEVTSKTAQKIQTNSELKTIDENLQVNLNEDNKEVSAENVDFCELAQNMNPDEMDLYDEEEQQNEDLKRLQELTEINDYSDEEDQEEIIKQNQAASNNDNQTVEIESNEHLSNLQSWSWNLSHQDRLIAAAKLIREICNFLKFLNTMITQNELNTARRALAEAGAQLFRSARIVGSTVVGASRRLEALRSAGPFAVVIEEACEVIEPTLISVLAVNTLKKLEMIGDHRQLPAFVQQCWFNFETTIPSIKISLFERLISGTVQSSNDRNKKTNTTAAVLPHTVLDEQRRMRSSICDITRPDYNDLVQILDHQHTGVQCIGDNVMRNCVDRNQVNNTIIHRDLWIDKGRSVPGLAQNIYFWNLLNNSESRPIAGLSACNLNEADAVASLTKWLLLCGCPPASITIITPYKGQKNAITLALRKNNCLPPYNRMQAPPRGTTLTISTVDRYQGDENDIVILSLVRCNPGNRFVGLKNRFVVAMSRARLGFFVIGSVKAVLTNRNGSEGPSHWRRFISSLNYREEKEEKTEEKMANTSRCGSELPICCPRHGSKAKLNVLKASDFPVETSWNKFCSLPCQAILERCGHLCNLPCHSPVDISHNKKCNQSLKRPCEIHSLIPLSCKEVDIKKQESLEDALNRYECKVKVDYCRSECGHIVEVECFIKKKLETKKYVLKDCCEIVSDYIHPICNHRFEKPNCSTKRKYELNSPKCTQKVLHTRPCGCEILMECYESIEESINPRQCNSSVEIARPRCGHILSMRCFEAEKLKEDWTKKMGKSAIKNRKVLEVEYSENYGPEESSINERIPKCLVPVTYIAQCGHKMANIPCSFSFDYASGAKKSPECTSKIESLCPICLSPAKIECWLSQFLQSHKIWSDASVLNKTDSGEISISEASFNYAIVPDFTPRIEKALFKLCNSKLNILRICSPKHVTTVNCYVLFEILKLKKSLKPCHLPIDRVLSCQHIISVDCSKKNEIPEPICKAVVNDVFTYSCGIHNIKPNICSKLTLLKTSDPKCTQQITCSRYRCSHSVTIPCFLKKSAEAFAPGTVLAADQHTIYSHVDYCDAEIDLPNCKEMVNYLYKECGHLRKSVGCSDAFSWAANNDIQPACNQLIEFNNPVCGHQNKAQCYEIVSMRTWNPWSVEAEKPKLSEYVLEHDENNEPVIAYSIDEKVFKLNPQPKEVSKEALECSIPFLLNRKCGHSLLTKCSNVFWQEYSNCAEPVLIECNRTDCGHKRTLSCYLDQTEKRTGKRSPCKNIVSRFCKKCRINKVDIECSQVTIECHSEVTIILPCNHEVSWTCGTDQDPRENQENCQSCIIAKWNELIISDISLARNRKLFEQTQKEIDKFLIDRFLSNNQTALLLNDFESHNKCRQEIMTRYLANARNKFINIHAPKTESLADLSFYELVFIEVKKDFQEKDNIYFEQTDTNYGRGCELLQLNLPGLKSCKPDENGLIHVLVGAAFKFKILPYSPPYLSSKNKKSLKAANKLSTKQKEEGFDGIESTPKESEIKKFVFWEPGSCVKLRLLSLKICEMCKICMDYFTDEKGYSCSKKHFLCWDCLEQHVNQASSVDSVGKCIDNEGSLLCPECSEPIGLLNVAKDSAPQNIFHLLENLKSEIKIRKAVSKALQDQEERLKKEFDRIMSIQDQEERMAERLRLEIIEEILTLRCPRCKCAFIDYSGCAALTCCKCSAGFCALCLQDCGSDAHQHVANCKENPSRDVWITEEIFNKHHSKRREVLIKYKIKNKDAKTKNLLCKKMDREFRDLGIKVDAILT